MPLSSAPMQYKDIVSEFVEEKMSIFIMFT